VRWLLVPIAAVAAFFAAALSVAAFDWIFWTFEYPCPRQQLTDAGACLNGSGATFEWFNSYLHVLVCLGAGLAAIYILAACTLVAPRHKARTSKITYTIGVIVAGAVAIASKSVAPSLTAMVAGAVAMAFLGRRYES
jgi:hypothetical protein